MPIPPLNRPSSHYTFASPSYHQDTSTNSNPRPAKSPRHQAPPELPSIYSSSTGATSDYTARYNAPYTSGSGGLPPLVSTISTTTGGGEYFPVPPLSMPMPMNMGMALPPAWSVAGIPAPPAYEGSLPGIAETGGGGGYDYSGVNGQHQQGYVKEEPGNGNGNGGQGQGQYTWNHS